MEQIERKTANLRHFRNLSFAFVSLPGIFHLFLLISTRNKSLIIEIKIILFLSRKVGRNFRNPSTKFSLFLTLSRQPVSHYITSQCF
jgi:hypothetical protein